MSHFESISGRLTGDALRGLRRQLDRPALSHDELLSRVEAHRLRVRAAHDANPLVNVALSEVLADTLVTLLGRLHDGISSELHGLVQGAVLYYAETDDADDDLATGFGFDDDREVIEAVRQTVDAA